MKQILFIYLCLLSQFLFCQSNGYVGQGVGGSTSLSGDVGGTTDNNAININTISTDNIIDGTILTEDISSGVIPTSLPPNGSASGDLGSTYPSPSVNKIRGRTVASTTPLDGHVLKWNLANSQWEPSTDNTGSSGDVTTVFTRDGDVVAQLGDYSASLISNTPANNISSITVQEALSELDLEKIAIGASAGGDLSSTYPNPSVVKIQNRAISNAAPLNNQVLKWSTTNAQWEPSTDNTGGGVTTVFGRNGDVVATSGDYEASLITNDAYGNISSVDLQSTIEELDDEKLSETAAFGGDVTGTYDNLQIADNTISSSNIINGTITAADIASGVIPTALPPNGAASGDLTSSYPSPTVARIQGRTISSTAPSNGQVLKWNNTNSQWEPSTDNTGTGLVNSVFGRSGNVVAASGDYTATQITNAPYNNVSSATVQTAINELEDEKLPSTATFGGDVSGTFSNLQLGANSVGTTEIANNAVTSAKIPDVGLPLSKLSQSGASIDNTVRWNGTNWVPSQSIPDLKYRQVQTLLPNITSTSETTISEFTGISLDGNDQIQIELIGGYSNGNGGDQYIMKVYIGNTIIRTITHSNGLAGTTPILCGIKAFDGRTTSSPQGFYGSCYGVHNSGSVVTSINYSGSYTTNSIKITIDLPNTGATYTTYYVSIKIYD